MTDIAYRKVAIQPIDRLKDAGGVMGDQYWLFVGIVFVGLIIGNVVPIILVGPMTCGIFKCYLERLQGRQASFETLFRGFDYFLESLIAAVIFAVGVLVVLLPFMCLIGGVSAMAGVSAEGDAEIGFAVFPLFVMIPVIVVFSLALVVLNIVFYFAFLLIVDRGTKAIPAVKAAFGATWANIGGLTAFAVISTLITGVAAMCCYVPMFLVLPYVFGAVTLAYRDIFSAKPTAPFGTATGYPPGAPKPPPIQ